MSKTINNFVVSFVLVLFSLFGLSACAGPLDNLKVTVSSNAIHEVEGGFEATLTLGDPTTDRINIQFHVAEDPLHCVARGTGIALKNIDQFSFLMR